MGHSRAIIPPNWGVFRICGPSRQERHPYQSSPIPRFDLYLDFLAAVTLLMLLPGPNVALIMANSVAHDTPARRAIRLRGLLVALPNPKTLLVYGALGRSLRYSGT
jgi:threonine/homoserine/homoserine lactone efflux protein